MQSISDTQVAPPAIPPACAPSAVEAAALAAIDQRRMLERTIAWASINSGTANLSGIAAVRAAIAGACASLPGTLTEIPAPPVSVLDPDGCERTLERGAHLHLTIRPEAPVQLVLTGHMDTVFPVDHGFQSVRDIGDGTINGPGTADMKGGIAVMIEALMALETSPVASRIGYEVVFNSDEETGSHGSAALIARAARGKHAALTFEPALPDGTLAGARPGSANYSVRITGRAAHAGRNPADGRNAIVAAADLALRLAALTAPGLTVNPARIDGGGPNNVVPDHAVLRVNLRAATPEQMRHVERSMAAITADIERAHDVAAMVHGGFNRPPKPVDQRAQRLFALVEDCGRALGLSLARRDTGGVCDGNNIAACGVPVVDTMGPRGGAIHSEGEFLIVDSLTERARLAALVMMRLGSGAAL